MEPIKQTCPVCNCTYSSSTPLFNLVCKKCIKETRNRVKLLKTAEDFANYCCDHRVKYYRIKIPYCVDDKGETIHVRTNCSLCKDEIRKELLLQKGKKNKQSRIQEASQESLLTKCCKIIANDPGQMLLAAVADPPLPPHVWDKIYDLVPKVLTKDFNEALDESARVNESEVMFRAIGELFHRYIKRRKTGF
jgi:hypothetical protein